MSPRLWLALALLALLAAGFYAEENWRGARAFATVQRDLESKGETLDWQRFVPPPIPDDQNLAFAPLFVRELAHLANPMNPTYLYPYGPDTVHHADLDDAPYAAYKPSTFKPTGFQLALRTDFAAYQTYYRQQPRFPHPAQPGSAPADVLLALTRYGPILDELTRAAAERPLTRFPVNWQREEFMSLSTTHYSLEQRLVATLALRASASLDDGYSADALRDIETALRLCRDLGNEPLLIAHLVQFGTVHLLLTPVWEGLADRRWSPAELARLQSDLSGVDLLAGFADAMRSERAANLRSINYLERHRDPSFLYGSSPLAFPPLAKILAWLVPKGWFDQNNAFACRIEQDYSIGAMDVPGHRYLFKHVEEGRRKLAATPRLPTTGLALIALPVFNMVGAKSARAQASLDEAVTAVALERSYQDHQTYPAHLDELVPAYLPAVPADVIDGQPLCYRPAADGRFQLYSVGLNNRDDGGQPAWTAPNRLDDKNGDWVWQYTPLSGPDGSPSHP